MDAEQLGAQRPRLGQTVEPAVVACVCAVGRLVAAVEL